MNSATLVLVAVAVKASLVLAAGLIAGAFAARASASARHRLWIFAMLGLLLLPLGQLALPPLPLHWLPAGAPIRTSSAPAPAVVTAPLDNPAGLNATTTPGRPLPPRLPTPDRCILALWLTGALLLLVRLFADAWRLRRLVRGAAAAPAAAAEAARLAPRIGMRRTAAVKATGSIHVPQAGGIFRRVILVPADFEAWPEDRRRLVLAHELAHLRRADPIWLWIARAAQAVYWWNPLVWVACRRQYLASEQACDDRAVAIAEADGMQPSDYAAHLIAVARSLIGAASTFSIATAMAREAFLEERVRAILDGSRPRRARRAVLAGIAALACTGFLPLAAARLSPATVPNPAVRTPPQNRTSAAPPTFDAVSIKPDTTAGIRYAATMDPTHLAIEQSSLQALILSAYKLAGYQLTGGPGWLQHTTFDVRASTSTPATPAQMMLMLRAALVDQFHLELAPITRTGTVFALAPAPGGSKIGSGPAPNLPRLTLPKSPDGSQLTIVESRMAKHITRDDGSQATTTSELIYGYKASMSELANNLAHELHAPVTDATRISGRFDFRLEYQDNPMQADPAEPSLNDALKEQLGLELKRTQGSYTVYIIRHVEPLSAR